MMSGFVSTPGTHICRRYYCMSLCTVLVIGTLHIILFSTTNQNNLVANLSQPESFFIDPDQRSYKRKFYSGALLTELSTDVPVSSSKGNVKRFQPSLLVSTNCVPFHLPYNQTINICVYPRDEDQLISSQLSDQGVWEEEHVRGLAYILKSEVNEVTVVDAGCNIGVYTLAAASLGHHVIALDPVSASLQLLFQSLLLANLSQQVTMLHNALAHTRRQFTTHVESGNIGGSSLSLQSSSQSESVFSVCLDDLVEYVITKTVVVKLDIEGWEERVLRCASGFFQRFNVRAVMMEWLFHRHTPGASRIIHFMLRNGLLPFAHGWRDKLLSPDEYSAWPDNIFWIKR